jgi:AraC-like DNA-binding protein
MSPSLLHAVARHATGYADVKGVARTPIPGLAVIRAMAPSEIHYEISRPLVCLVVQGCKQVTSGATSVAIGAGDSLLITADVPTVSQITTASEDAPYFSLVLDLDRAVVCALAAEMASAATRGPAVQAEPTDGEVADAALRMMRLVARPEAVPVLQAQLVREMHYWLLVGRHGPAVRRLGGIDGAAARIARAVAVIRADFAAPIPVDRLAQAAGMSASSFHAHFRAATTLSPLQFQKQLRLIEARRVMRAEGLTASAAAFRVGYESIPQFTREYRRLFGRPPGTDRKLAAAATGSLKPPDPPRSYPRAARPSASP